MTVTHIPRMFTVPQAAKLAKVSPDTIRSQIRAGHLVPRRIGRCVRILDTELKRWMEGSGTSDVPGVRTADAPPRVASGATPGTSMGPNAKPDPIHSIDERTA